MKDVELMKKCVEDAYKILLGFVANKAYYQNHPESVATLAAELFNFRTFTGQYTITMDGEDETDDIPFD